VLGELVVNQNNTVISPVHCSKSVDAHKFIALLQVKLAACTPVLQVAKLLVHTQLYVTWLYGSVTSQLSGRYSLVLAQGCHQVGRICVSHRKHLEIGVSHTNILLGCASHINNPIVILRN
jgi:hypothetical protein